MNPTPLLLIAAASGAANEASPHAFATPVVTTTQASYLPTPFDYSYIDVLYQSIDGEGGVPTREGFAFRGSFDVTDNIRLLAGIGQATGKTPAGDDKVSDYSLGFGLHGSYDHWLDVVGNFEWTRREFRGVVQGRHKGWLAKLGLRALPVDFLEVEGGVLFQNSAENDIGGELGLVWHWHDYVGFRANAFRIGEETRFTAGLRFSL